GAPAQHMKPNGRAAQLARNAESLGWRHRFQGERHATQDLRADGEGNEVRGGRRPDARGVRLPRPLRRAAGSDSLTPRETPMATAAEPRPEQDATAAAKRPPLFRPQVAERTWELLASRGLMPQAPRFSGAAIIVLA